MNDSRPTVMLVCSLARSLVNFRGDLVSALIDEGYRVVCAAPQMPAQTRDALLALGAEPVEYPLSRAGLNPRTDLATIRALRRLIVKHRVDVLYPYTIKPVVYGAMAARAADVAVVALISGLGFTFSGASLKARCLQPLTTWLYRLGLRNRASVIFQNTDDQQLFIDRGIVTDRNPQRVVGGSGVHLDRYPAKQGYSAPPRVRFLMLTRLIEEKGVRLYLEAAEQLAPRYPQAEFHLFGRLENTPSAIDEALLTSAHERGTVVFHGQCDSAHAALNLCDVFVLPSFYREGIPRSLLEALSSGLAIVTTNTPGCRETVQDGVNGVLVPPRDGVALVHAFERLLEAPERIPALGAASRALAEGRFDVHRVNSQTLQAIGQALQRR